MKYLLAVSGTVLAMLLAGCDKGPESPRGFSLPKGDVEQGELVFKKYNCSGCHQIEGIAQPDNAELSIALGGKTTRVKTYAELVTSVINPSHKFATGYPKDLIQENGQSKMTIFNDVMTVSELVDLVAFLQPHYELVPYKSTDYGYYMYH